VKRALRKPLAERAVWRNGVQLVGTPIWCDARGIREVNFVSHRGTFHPGRQLIMTEPAKLWLGKKADGALTPQFSRPFSLGELRLELYPSGLNFDSASLLVDVKGHRVAYAGSIAPWADDFELRAADTVILDTRYSHLCFPPRAQLEAEVDAFVDRGGVSVLVCESETTAMVLSRRYDKRPLFAHRAAHAYLGGWSVARPVRKKLPDGAIVFCPLGKRMDIPGARVALVDASALARPAGFDATIAWNDRAGQDGLVDYVVATGASQVYAMGGLADGFVAALPGVRMVPLGPPAQLSLF
jgi:putative mRNA 3-end processing factor